MAHRVPTTSVPTLHTSSPLKVWCTVGPGNGTDNRFEVVSFVSTFEMNAIPNAQIIIPVGRKATDVTVEAKVHKAVDSFTIQDKVFVFLHYPGAPATASSPKDVAVIFEGYLTGTGFRRSSGDANYVLHVRHWLVDLDHSSCLSENSHPTNPAQLSFPSVVQFGGAGSTSGMTPYSLNGEIFDKMFTNDFWGILVEWLKFLADQNMFNDTEHALLSAVPLGTKNDSALKALDRFSFTGDYQEMLFVNAGADDDALAQSIQRDIQHQTYQSYANTTFWNQIVRGFAANYLFSIVPRVLDAYAVPFVPGLRTPYAAKIEAGDYAQIDLGGHLERDLLAMGIMNQGRDLSGVTQQGSQKIGGWFSPASVVDGMVMIKHGPSWMQDTLVTDAYLNQAVRPGGPVGSAISPAPVPAGPLPTPATIAASSGTIMNNYAHALYIYEKLKSRQGSLTGKLRFDIAPGSTVKIEGAGEKFIESGPGIGDRLGQAMFASVLRVTIVINAQNNQAHTAFTLAYTRNNTENSDPSTSLAKHPLYDAGNWAGTHLGILE